MPKPKQWWYAFTPAGTILVQSKSLTEEGCIQHLLRIGSHMPYSTWENFQKRGYTVEQLGVSL